jgi:IMP dehydrogenase
MERVKEILKTKGGEVWSTSPDASVFHALLMMADKNVGALVVLEAGALVGILSERDVARQVINHDRSPREIPVREMMSNVVRTVSPEDSVRDCMALMTEERIRHLPVLEHGSLAGIVSIGDVVKATIDLQTFTIQQLETYITGKGGGGRPGRTY